MKGINMRKSIYILILILFASTCFAGGVTDKVKSVIARKNAAAPACDSCTGGLLFSWHCEDVDVTAGTPCGCVASGGDSTATANSTAAINNDHTAYDGSSHCDFPTAADNYYFTVASNDLINPAAGTIIFYTKIQTYGTGATLFYVYADATNNIKVTMLGTDEVRITYKGDNVAVSASTTAANLATNTWYKITAKWSVTGVGGKYLYISVNDANAVDTASAITAFTAALGANSLKIGEGDSVAADFAIDNVKIYDSWL